MEKEGIKKLADEALKDVSYFSKVVAKEFFIKGYQKAQEENYSIVQILEQLNHYEHIDDAIAYFFNNPKPVLTKKQ